MTHIEAFFLGIIQGLTEFFPVSSTGHLFLGRQLFGLKDAGLFLDTMLHVGTLLAVLVIYKNELKTILKNPFHKLSLLLVVGTIPAVIIGFLFEDYFDAISKTGVTIGWEFLITGFILWFADSVRNGAKKMNDLSYKDALFIGSFQAAAIFPALSRSGLTIAAGLWRKLDRETAAYFSFFLSIPAIFGGILLQSKKLWSGSVETITLSSLLVGTITAAIFGYVAMITMVHILKKKSLKMFAVYVWILGGFVLLMQYQGVM